MKKEFRKTTIDKIPEDWQMLTLGHIGKLTGGYAFDSSKFNDDKNGYQVIRMGNIQPYGLELNKNPVFISHVSVKEEKFILQKGDLLITLTGTIGKTDYGNVAYIEEVGKMVLNQRVGKFEYEENIVGKFLFYVFDSFEFKKQFFERGKGGTGNQANVGKEGFESITIYLPPKYEQQKIASILSAVDAKIELIDEQIEHTGQLKKGLMQRLLTQGIGHTKFKDSSLGSIPEWWEVKTLSDLGEIIMGQSPPGETYNTIGEGMPMLNGPTEFTNVHPIPNQYTTKVTKVARAGDILFCVRASIGKMNIADREYCIGRGLAAIRAKPNSTTQFIYFQLQSIAHKILREAKDMGSTFPNVNSKELAEKIVALPPLEEQQKIASILSTIDEKISILEEKKSHYQQLKKGLMQQLLTGKIRVKLAEKASIPAL